MRLRNFALAALIVAACFGGGCSFSREFKAASRQPPPTDDITGAWVGRWKNSNNSHEDRLKAVITRVSDHQYEARFKAWWFRILSGSFRATLNGQWEGGEFVFQGSQRVMGWEFKQQGRANATNFTSEYSSSNYRGMFIMERPAPSP